MRHIFFFVLVVLAGCSSTVTPLVTSSSLPDDGGINADVAPSRDAQAPACGPQTPVQADPQNCGSCNHACGGGGCISGSCTPGTLDTNVMSPSGVVMDATYVYWTASATTLTPPNGRVRRCLVADCGPGSAEDVATGLSQPNVLAADETTLYWIDPFAQSLFSCPKSGCGGTPTLLLHGMPSVTDMAVVNGSLYWIGVQSVGMFPQPVTYHGVLMSCPVSDCSAPKTLATLGMASGQYETPQTSLLTIANGIAYFTLLAFDSQNVTSGTGQVLSCPITGCGTPNILASGRPSPQAVAVTATDIYWSEWGTPLSPVGSILTCPIAGCGASTPTTVVANQVSPYDLTVDGSALFWTNAGVGYSYGAGAVMSIPLGGGTPAVLADGQKRPGVLRVGPSAIAWVTRGTPTSGHIGTVMRLMR